MAFGTPFNLSKKRPTLFSFRGGLLTFFYRMTHFLASRYSAKIRAASSTIFTQGRFL